MLGAAGAEVLVNDLVPERTEGGRQGDRRRRWPRRRRAVRRDRHRRGARHAIGRLGPVDILVNNAGNAGQPDLMGSFELDLFVDTDPATWDRYIKVNFYGVMYCTHACLPGDDRGAVGADRHHRLRRLARG